MQLMPATANEVAAQLGLKNELSSKGLFNPELNIKLGTKYLKGLISYFDENIDLALKAYNWGMGNVRKAENGKKRVPRSVKGYSKKIEKVYTSLLGESHYS